MANNKHLCIRALCITLFIVGILIASCNSNHSADEQLSCAKQKPDEIPLQYFLENFYHGIEYQLTYNNENLSLYYTESCDSCKQIQRPINLNANKLKHIDTLLRNAQYELRHLNNPIDSCVIWDGGTILIPRDLHPDSKISPLYSSGAKSHIGHDELPYTNELMKRLNILLTENVE